VSFVDKMGHFRRIRLLESAESMNSNVADLMYYVKVVDRKAEIIKESVKHQILSVFTAFLCV
jgi:archaellum component FlaC